MKNTRKVTTKNSSNNQTSNTISHNTSYDPTMVRMNKHGVLVPSDKAIKLAYDIIEDPSELDAKSGLVFGAMLKDTFNAMLQGEMDNHLGYGSNEKVGISTNTGNSRNGYSSKKINTQFGEQVIDIPRDRKSEFNPTVIGKYQKTGKSIEEQILNLYAIGTTNSEIVDFLKKIYGLDFSDQYITNVTDKIIPLINDWKNRRLDPIYPIVYLDAIRVKTREDNLDSKYLKQVISKTFHIVLGINLNGEKEILGYYATNTENGGESSKFWLMVLNDLKCRGVKDILICCVDNLKGFSESIEAVYPNTMIQKCIIHQLRNSTKYVVKKDLKEFSTDIKAVYTSKDEETAKEIFKEFKAKWSAKYSYAVKSWENNWNESFAFMELPNEIRKLIYTTNTIEGLNRQLRKHTKKKSSYPSTQSVEKQLFLTISNLKETWTKSKANWGLILSQLTIIYEERIIKYIEN